MTSETVDLKLTEVSRKESIQTPSMSPVRENLQLSTDVYDPDKETYGDELPSTGLDYRLMWQNRLSELKAEYVRNNPRRTAGDPDKYFEKHYFELDTLVDEM